MREKKPGKALRGRQFTHTIVGGGGDNFYVVRIYSPVRHIQHLVLKKQDLSCIVNASLCSCQTCMISQPSDLKKGKNRISIHDMDFTSQLSNRTHKEMNM